jgi:TolB-like protein
MLLLGLVSGCATGPTYEAAESSRFIQANYSGVESLLASSKYRLDKDLPLVVATLVNVDKLTESSRFGRALSEQIGSKFTKLGYSVVELKLRENIFVKQSEGEFLLSREAKDISSSHKAQAMVVGTYAEGRDYVYVHLKLIGIHDNLVLAAHDYVLPLDSNVKSLLKPGRYAD